MAIKVQCDQCGSAMNIREDYAGTERKCPKCGSKFKVPTLAEVAAGGGSGGGGAAGEGAGEDFDAVAFLTGEAPGGKKKPATKIPAAPPSPKEFDPLDVLGGGKTAPAKDKSSPGSKSSPKLAPTPAPAAPAKAEEEFDPLAVLGKGPTPAAPPAAEAPKPAEPEPHKPKRPSWTKPLPEEKAEEAGRPAAETPAAEAPKEPEPYKPKRPSWAKPLPEEKPDEAAPAAAGAKAGAPQEPEPYKPKRPSWAKPLPDEKPAPAAPASAAAVAGGAAASPLTAVAADASPAAKAAAAAMGGQVQGSLPPEPEAKPRRPLFDKEAFVAGLKRRARMIAITIPVACVLFGISWLAVRPGHVAESDLVPPPGRLAPVSGLVTLDGKPLAGARVLFHPKSNQYRSPEAVTDAEGRYVLEFCAGYSGAPPGRYRVQLERVSGKGQDTIPAAFGQATRQEKVVGPDGATVDLSVTTPKTLR